MCEALGVGGGQLRTTIEWQLAGQISTAGAAPLPPPAVMIGVGVTTAARVTKRPAVVPAAPRPRPPRAAPAPLSARRDATLASWAAELTPSPALLAALWRRVHGYALQALPHWMVVLSCALVLLLGGAVVV